MNELKTIEEVVSAYRNFDIIYIKVGVVEPLVVKRSTMDNATLESISEIVGSPSMCFMVKS